jgi:uncharacterized repeat protein (TIGR04138 family)
MATRILTRDLPCIQCGYNLRGLGLNLNCPECGWPVSHTWTATKAKSHVGFEEIADEIILDWITAGADAAAIPVDGVRFVLDAIGFFPSGHRTGPLDDKGARHLSDLDVCTAVREYARFYFSDPDEARECLAEWHVRTSEDVGAIIAAMVDAGIIAPSSQDSRQAYQGVFKFEDLIGGIVKQAEPA